MSVYARFHRRLTAPVAIGHPVNRPVTFFDRIAAAASHRPLPLSAGPRPPYADRSTRTVAAPEPRSVESNPQLPPNEHGSADPASVFRARIPPQQRFRLRSNLAGGLDDAYMLAGELLSITDNLRLYLVNSSQPNKEPYGILGRFEQRRSRRAHAQTVTGYVTDTIRIVELFFGSDLFSYAPPDVLAAYQELGLDRFQALDRINVFASAGIRGSREAVMQRARDLHQWSRRLSHSLQVFYGVLNDVRGADLRGENLEGIDLTGLRWSTATQWPPEWIEWIAHSSITIDDDVFEIARGTGRDRSAVAHPAPS
ncbi:hypothetical protein IU500_34520 [Nocardia terpenica]|uniref:hypothetical protein n=1 Tax=Nocardia terpenica TaxID=455432 RepID=UPI0018943753|nr:hypothetical protein [Nocardia terpenica]MBF6065449.1 hypothetical protein [Nocardia terpenica]MBF6109131.1 hypothetical protein [Nocardia terpenica]MBF6114667.1 hypothetical protein [Nocardia terpenica]MBF6123352.1 hypothetical protein [Nocardia terpenica]MBF6156630.1 hypothetical protein [Nocardia terpenica]